MMAATVDNHATALALALQGFSIFPCHSGGTKAKQPMPFIKWRDVSTKERTQITAWWQKWPDAAVGLDLGKSGLLVIDADRHGEDDGVEAFGALMAENGFDPDSAPLVATPNQGNHHFFRQPPGRTFGNGRGMLPAGVDVRGDGGYVIAPGTVMADGRFYELHGNLDEAPAIPEWLSAIITAKKGGAETDDLRSPVAHSPASADEIVELLSFIPADCGYHDWISVLMAIHAATAGAGLGIADAWSAQGSKYPGAKELAKKWRSFKGSGITGSTLAELARQYGADLSAIAMKHRSVTGYDPVEAATAARRLIQAHDGTLADAETGEVIGEAQALSVISLPTPKATLPTPPGLVGEIAGWITATARRPQPELALGAALAIVGTAAGRQFGGPTRSGTHLYVLGLAPTGTGKDHPLQSISRIMTAAKMAQHLGPSEFISMPAVVNFLTRRPLAVCPMDEFGAFMKRINSKRASGFEGAISKVIRTMWSSSFAPYPTPEWAGRASEMIFSPSLSLFGASTPEQFYSAMEGASIEDGTLNRFLLLKGQDQVSEVDPALDPAIVPAHLVDGLRSIYDRSGPLAATYRNDATADAAAAGHVRIIPWCNDGALQRYRAFSREIEQVVRSSPDRAPFFARTVEIALRIATIIAVGRGEDDQVRVGDLESGIAIATASATLMADGAADYMADNENQANAQKVMRIVKGRGGRVKHRDLLVAMKHSMKARDLRDLLASMCEAGQLERFTIETRDGPDAVGYLALGAP